MKIFIVMKLTADRFQFDDLSNGNPLQLRTTISSDGMLKKGDVIQVQCGKTILDAKVISDPVKIVDLSDNNVEVSVEVVKTERK